MDLVSGHTFDSVEASDGAWHTVSWRLILSGFQVTVDASVVAVVSAAVTPHTLRNNQAILYLGARPLFPGKMMVVIP